MRSSFIHIGFFLVILSAVQAQTFNYFNGTFTPGSWTTMVETGAGGSTSSSSQIVSGGNPGSYLEVVNTSNNEFISTFVLFGGSAFNPSTQGGITGLNYSISAYNYYFANSQGFAPALRQGGVGYLYLPEDTSYPQTWATITWSNITAASFQTWGSSSAHPDFSTSGGLIEFGFTNTDGAFGNRTTYTGYDNFSVTVSYSAIPEPSTYAMLAGLAALGLALWRRNTP